VVPIAAPASPVLSQPEEPVSHEHDPLPPPVTYTAHACRALLDSMPAHAARELDAWALRMVACPPLETSPETAALECRIEDATTFARQWQALRASAPDRSREFALLEAYFVAAAVKKWMYMDGCVYSCGARDVITLAGDVAAVLVRLSPPPDKDYFLGQPAAVAYVAKLVDTACTREGRSLRVDASSIRYLNATAVLSVDGVSVVPTPAISLVRPVVPRAYVQSTISIADHMDTSWQNDAYVDPQLHVMLGAILRPPALRRGDARPILLLATHDPVLLEHPLITTVREYCQLSIVSALPATPGQAFVLLLDQGTLTDAAVSDIHTALDMGMAVVVHGHSVPQQFAAPEHARLRYCAVHVHADTPLRAGVLEDARHHILPATQAAYKREGRVSPQNRFNLSFLNSLALSRHRVPGPADAVSVVVELLQCGMGLQIRPGQRCALTAVAAVYDTYAAARHVFEPVTAEAVLQAAVLYRSMFGRMVEVCSVAHDAGVFTNLCTVKQ
jgi:hypothetical protein